MSIYKYFRALAGRKEPQKPVNADTNLEKALRILIARGHITVRDILRFTNDGTKLIFLLRKGGYLYPLGSGKGETWIENASGVGRHKQYTWTRKVPRGWVTGETYMGKDRRKQPRGGCR